MKTKTEPLQLSFPKALFLVLLAAAVIVCGKMIFQIDTTVVLLLSGLVTSTVAVCFGCSYHAIQEEIIAAFGRMSVAIMILLPLIVVLVLIFLKKPTLPTLAAGAVAGVLVAVLFQGENITASMAALSAGYTGDSGSAIVNSLINRGGITGMIGTVSIVIGATAFGAPLKASGAILTLLDRLHRSVKTQKQLMLLTAVLHPVFFVISGAYYVSYSVIGGIMSPMYDNYHLKREQLSTILGLTGITLAPLIPWCPAGAFVLSQLGVDTIKFLPFSFYSLAAPVVCFIFIFAGIGFARTKGRAEQTAAE